MEFCKILFYKNLENGIFYQKIAFFCKIEKNEEKKVSAFARKKIYCTPNRPS